MDGALNASRNNSGSNRNRNSNSNSNNQHRHNNRHINHQDNRQRQRCNNYDQFPDYRSRSRSRSRTKSRSRSQERYRNRHQKGRATVAVTTNKTDPNLPILNDDPRSSDPSKRISRKALTQAKGRNTESFHAESTFVRPDLRIQIGSNRIEEYNKKLKHDDVVIVPELFGDEDDLSLYYKLVEEMRDIQEKEKENGENENNVGNSNGLNQHNNGRNQKMPKSEWIPWHEGAHLISKKTDDSPTFQSIVKRLCTYFNIDTNKPTGTRFNWYRDSNDWKPFHHDSAAFNPSRAKNQNITIGVSFGSVRELAFIRAKPFANYDGDHGGSITNNNAPDNKCKLYFPQNNNGVFSFGRDANILWKHGINALPPSEQDGKGRISIILWGFAKNVIEEEGSPPLLGADGKGPHAGGGRHGGRRNFGQDRRNGRDRNDGYRRDDNNHHDRTQCQNHNYRDRRNDGWRRDERSSEKHHSNINDRRGRE